VTESVQGGRAPRGSRARVTTGRTRAAPADRGEPPARYLPGSGRDIVATDDTSEVIVALGVPRAQGLVGPVETVPGRHAAWLDSAGRAAVAP
jgi:hypothetical protein